MQKLYKRDICRSLQKDSEELGWIKLINLNLIVLQQVFNELRSDNERKNSKKILVDMLEKAIDADLLIKNVAKQINTKVSKEDKKEHPEFEKFSPHCFRHTFATRAIENGMQPKTLQKILGHGSLQMTMDLYCHVTDDTLFEAMRLMEKVV